MNFYLVGLQVNFNFNRYTFKDFSIGDSLKSLKDNVKGKMDLRSLLIGAAVVVVAFVSYKALDYVYKNRVAIKDTIYDFFVNLGSKAKAAFSALYNKLPSLTKKEALNKEPEQTPSSTPTPTEPTKEEEKPMVKPEVDNTLKVDDLQATANNDLDKLEYVMPPKPQEKSVEEEFNNPELPKFVDMVSQQADSKVEGLNAVRKPNYFGIF